MNPSPETPSITLADGVLNVAGNLSAATVNEVERALAGIRIGDIRVVDGSGVTGLDSSGAVLVNRIAGGKELRGFSEKAARLLAMSRIPEAAAARPRPARRPGFEAVGDWGLRAFGGLVEILVLIVDILYWSAVGIFDRRQYRRGSFTDQAYYMGSTALPIIAVITFLVGAILALQSAAQLRQFGATIFVVDLLAIGLACEMAPLMVGILVSGRSGSAIASEIATMKFTEELDAIRTMGLNPIRFVVVPKLWAMMIGMPLLSVMALLIGLFGGFVVAVSYMQLTPVSFYNELLRALFFKDIMNGIVKSISYAVIITVVGTYRGLTFTGGADGVGRATTASVVTSLFAIVVADSIWSIIFYLPK